MREGFEWWTLPGPAGFVSRVMSDLWTSGIAVVECPRPLPVGFQHALARKLTDELAAEAVSFNASDAEVGGSIIHSLALARGVAGVAIGTVADFLSDPDLEGTAFVVDGVTREAVSVWGALLRTLVLERKRQAITSGPYLVVLAPTGLGKDDARRLRGAVTPRKMIGTVTSLDTGAWVAASGIRIGAGIIERLAVATVIEVAAWSRELLELGLAWDEEDQLAPISRLQVLAGSRSWPYPCWENGLVDLWDDVPVPHAAAAVAHNLLDEIDRRVWAAQARALLPMVDAVRRGLIRKYLDELERHASPEHPYVKQINDRVLRYDSPWQFEWYEILTLLEPHMSHDERNGALAFKRARDWLSHGKPAANSQLYQLSEWWERLADSLPASVPGWDWPRAGQRLMMTVGPAASGKSNWAASQGHPVVSTESITLELHGSLSVSDLGQTFRVARNRAGDLLRTGSDVVLDATHIGSSDRVRNAKMVPNDLPVEYVVIDRDPSEDISSQGMGKTVLAEVPRLQFQDREEGCLAGDSLPNVRVIDLRNIKR
ncbi:hypothetical protein C8D77_104520 [Mesorhizobium loti]|uniref:Uncharacterized protein n=2 Tax=Rhizobium loti TaxID=381 RepID=A0A8E2WFI2_RHILI|nr:hypothetical protein C8D77_104520 [Mesorhizobium loti]